MQIAAAGERALWGLNELLLAGVVNLLQTANWQRQGKENAPRPKPILPPGELLEGERSFGRDAIPISEFNDWWDNN